MPVPITRRRFSKQDLGNPSLLSSRGPTPSDETSPFINKRVSKPSSTDETALPGRSNAAGQALPSPKGEAELGPAAPNPVAAQAPDEGPLLDAWHASFPSRSVTVGLLKRGAARFDEEMVFKDDDRRQITNTSEFPWRCICSLVITAADGSRWVGTGWLAGARTVITAGHCVYLQGRGGWAQKVEIYPGRNGTDTSLGSFTSTELKSVTGWTDQRNPLYDYGAILLPSKPSSVGWFAYGVYETSELRESVVNVFGYPADKQLGTLWGTARRLEQVIPQKLVYDLSTYGGQSGCPVFVKDGEKRTVVGIHNYGDVVGNSATRITDAVFDDIEAWKAEAP